MAQNDFINTVETYSISPSFTVAFIFLALLILTPISWKHIKKVLPDGITLPKTLTSKSDAMTANPCPLQLHELSVTKRKSVLRYLRNESKPPNITKNCPREVRFLRATNPKDQTVIIDLLKLRGFHYLEARSYCRSRAVICWLTGHFAHRARDGSLDEHDGMLIVDFPELSIKQRPPYIIEFLVPHNERGKKMHDYVQKHFEKGTLDVAEAPRPHQPLRNILLTLCDLEQPGMKLIESVILVLLDECFQALADPTKLKKGQRKLDRVVLPNGLRPNLLTCTCDHTINELVTDMILHTRAGTPEEVGKA